MPYSDSTRPNALFSNTADHRSRRVRQLAEAGAAGRMLAPHEVKEICEALRGQSIARTNFHSGVG